MNSHAHMRAQRDAHKNYWASELIQWFEHGEADIHALRIPLSAFAHRIRVVLADGSTLDLQDAFFVVNQEREAVGIFTEHCGYFTFSHFYITVYQDEKLAFQGPE